MKNNFCDEVSPHKRRLKKLILIMKLTTLFSIALSLNLGASVYSQNTKFSLDLNGKTVREVFPHTAFRQRSPYDMQGRRPRRPGG